MNDIVNKDDVLKVLKNAAKELIATAPPIGMPDDCILHDKSKYTKVHKSGRPRWKDGDGKLYEWDALHGEIEVYNPKGNHLYVKDPSGKTIGQGIPGRKINVR